MARGNADGGPHPTDVHVGRRVQEKRLGLGYNQSDLGRALGLTFQQIQKYEKGNNRISASKLLDTARFFKVDIGYFFEGLDGAIDAPTDRGPEAPLTRYSVEVSRSLPHLDLADQKLVADLVRSLGRVQTALDEQYAPAQDAAA